MRKFALSAALLTFAAPFVAAAAVHLTDGRVVYGTVLQEDAAGVQLQTPEGVLFIKIDRVDHIDYEDAANAVTPPPPPFDGAATPFDEPERRNLVLIGLGSASPLAADQFNQLGGPGGILNIEYLREVSDLVSLGLGLDVMGFAQKSVDTVPASYQTTTGATSFLFLAHITPWNHALVAPYGALGLGFNSYVDKVSGTPNPGYVWADTGTTETRTGDDTSRGVAVQVGGGLQANFTPQFVGRLEADWRYLSINDGAFGVNALEAVTVELQLGRRF